MQLFPSYKTCVMFDFFCVKFQYFSFEQKNTISHIKFETSQNSTFFPEYCGYGALMDLVKICNAQRTKLAANNKTKIRNGALDTITIATQMNPEYLVQCDIYEEKTLLNGAYTQTRANTNKQ